MNPRRAGVTLGLLLMLGAGAPRLVVAQSAEDAALMAWVDDHRAEAVELLEELTNINSYTLNPEGVREVAEWIGGAFGALLGFFAWKLR